MVDVKDLDDDPNDANHLLWLGLDAFTVTVHTLFIWALALPLALACIGFQVCAVLESSVRHHNKFSLHSLA